VVRIAILVHEHDHAFDEPTIRAFRDHWLESGHAVEIAQGTRRRVEADVVVNHVDLTVTPPEYREYMAAFPAGVNRELVDISKTVVSSNLVRSPDDGDDGPVIVKTDANAGGGRDLALAAKTGVRGRLAWKWARARAGDLTRARFLPVSTYPIFESARAVPAGVWRNRHLVVERFLSERAGDLYVARTWWYFGTRGLNPWIHATDPIAKGHAIVARGILDEPPPAAVEEIRARLHADFGRIDYAVVDGEAVVYDLNRTPATSEGARQFYGPEILALAPAITEFT
jgi:hypothetical protein